MITCILLGLLLVGISLFYIYVYKLYKLEVVSISSKEYPLRVTLPIGLFILDHYFKLKVSKTNYNLLQLYGRHEYSWRKRIYEAERIALSAIVVFLTVCILFILSLKALAINEINAIEKKNFGEGHQIYKYYYDLKIPEVDGKDYCNFSDNITVIVPEVKPTKEEILIELQSIKEKLPSIILKENISFEHVNKPLYLPNKLSENIHIDWVSSNNQLIQDNGQIRYNNLLKEGEGVNIVGKIECYGIKDTVEYAIKLYKKTLSADEQRKLINGRIKMILSKQSLMDNKGKSIDLPRTFNDYDVLIDWYDGDQKVSTILFLIIGLSISCIFYYLKQWDLACKVKQRHEQLLRDFPGFVNKFALLMNAGMTFSKAWEKIASDYVRVKKSSGEIILLYEEMLLTIEDLQKGMSEIKAYEAFGHRCKIPEVLRFSAVVIQNIKKGSHLLINAMEHQAKEALTLREDLARRKGEKASTKLVLPMGIMFIAILIIVITPALITLQL